MWPFTPQKWQIGIKLFTFSLLARKSRWLIYWNNLLYNKLTFCCNRMDNRLTLLWWFNQIHKQTRFNENSFRTRSRTFKSNTTVITKSLTCVIMWSNLLVPLLSKRNAFWVLSRSVVTYLSFSSFSTTKASSSHILLSAFSLSPWSSSLPKAQLTAHTSATMCISSHNHLVEIHH